MKCLVRHLFLLVGIVWLLHGLPFTYSQEAGPPSALAPSKPIVAGIPPSNPTAMLVTPARLMIQAVQGQVIEREVSVRSGAISQTRVRVGQALSIDGTHALPKGAVALNGTNTEATLMAPDGLLLFTVNMDLNDVRSGEYAGDVFLTTSNALLSIPTTIKVKDGPVGVLATLLICIAASFFMAKYRETGRFRDEIIVAASKWEVIAINDSDLHDVHPFWAAIRNALDAVKMQLDVGNPSLANTSLLRLEGLMVRWVDHRSDWIRSNKEYEALVKLAQASTDDGVSAALKDAKQKREEITSAKDASDFIQCLKRLASKLGTGGASLAGGETSPSLQRFTPGFTQRAHRNLVIYVWGAYSISLFALLLVGYGELYFENPVFGAKGWLDYTYIVLWCFGAENATRSAALSIAKGFKVSGFA